MVGCVQHSPLATYSKEDTSQRKTQQQLTEVQVPPYRKRLCFQFHGDFNVRRNLLGWWSDSVQSPFSLPSDCPGFGSGQICLMDFSSTLSFLTLEHSQHKVCFVQMDRQTGDHSVPLTEYACRAAVYMWGIPFFVPRSIQLPNKLWSQNKFGTLLLLMSSINFPKRCFFYDVFVIYFYAILCSVMYGCWCSFDVLCAFLCKANPLGCNKRIHLSTWSL